MEHSYIREDPMSSSAAFSCSMQPEDKRTTDCNKRNTTKHNDPHGKKLPIYDNKLFLLLSVRICTSAMDHHPQGV
jgi:hypothetical protein